MTEAHMSNSKRSRWLFIGVFVVLSIAIALAINLMTEGAKGDSYFAEVIQRIGAGFGLDIEINDETSLNLAVEQNNIDEVSRLISKGADVNADSARLATPLVFASAYCAPDMITVLLRGKADPNLGSTKTRSFGNASLPLHAAAVKGRKDIVKLLLAAGANPNAKSLRGGYVPMHCVAIYSPTDAMGACEVAKELIEAKADINATDQNGSTPLDWASKEGETKFVSLLRESGAQEGTKIFGP